MAYTTQAHFLKVRYPHELTAKILDNSAFTTTTYTPCTDLRSWSLNKHERSQYYLELLSASTQQHHHEKAHHESKKVAAEKQKEVESLKKEIKELQDQIAILACKLESCQSSKNDVECMQNKLTENSDKMEELQNLLNESKEAYAKIFKEYTAEKEEYTDALAKATDAYAELEANYTQIKCALDDEREHKDNENQNNETLCELHALQEENIDLKRSLKESCKKIGLLNAELASYEKDRPQLVKGACTSDCQVKQFEDTIHSLQSRLADLERENCTIQGQLADNEHIKIAEAQINQLTRENQQLREQLECAHQRRSGHDYGNEYDLLREELETIREERDALQEKFLEIQPELEELSNVVQDFQELETDYYELRDELDNAKFREEELIEKINSLMSMECEFKALQKRVCESERLLNEYQVLTKLECLRGFGEDDEEQPKYNCPNPESSESSALDLRSAYNESIPNLDLHVTYHSKKRKCNTK